MKKNHKDEIGRLFQTVKMNKGDIEQQLQLTQESNKGFLEDFRALCRNSIDPTMREIGDHIRASGGDYHIDEFQEEQLKQLGISGMPFIRMTVAFPGNEIVSLGGSNPGLVFAGDKYRRKVICNWENIEHPSGADLQTTRQWAIEEITPDKVEKSIMDFLKVLIPR
jgi:hypothetical protein